MKPQTLIFASLVALALPATWGPGPAMAQPPDSVDLTNLIGFLSSSTVADRPTFVIEPGRVDDVLTNVGAESLDDGQYKLEIGGDTVTFEILIHSDLASFYPGGIPLFAAGDPDQLVLTYRDRECNGPVPAVDTKGSCRYDLSKRLYVQTLDPPKQKCVPGSGICSEYPAVGWRHRFFYDSCCTTEAPNEDFEIQTHYCIRCP